MKVATTLVLRTNDALANAPAEDKADMRVNDLAKRADGKVEGASTPQGGRGG